MRPYGSAQVSQADARRVRLVSLSHALVGRVVALSVKSAVDKQLSAQVSELEVTCVSLALLITNPRSVPRSSESTAAADLP